MEVPKSPFTLEGLKQSGISAFNQIKNRPIRTLMSPMVPKNPYMAVGLGLTGIYGLLPESTKRFISQNIPAGDLDFDFARREALKAKARNEARKSKTRERPTYGGILDYMETDDFENQKLTNDIVENSKVKIKEDDIETGPEKLENKTPDLEVKEETIIENNTPNNNKNNTQMAVENQKKSIKKSEQIVTDIESEARKQGKMTVLNEALEAARGVMGERGYKKSGRLLLLQLASGLLSGKTMQPGVTGFLDVLGQAGQQVIPMAIALEREREKDEMDLAKLFIESDKKTTKLCSKNKKKDVRNTLAGHLDDEYSIDKHEYQKIVAPYLDAFREGHARFYTLQIKPLATTSVWVNYMKAGDYNPTHIHTGCEFSSVLYTSIPKSLKREAKNHIANSSVPGSISFTAFINHSPSHFGSVKYFPEEGDFFIFPFAFL